MTQAIEFAYHQYNPDLTQDFGRLARKYGPLLSVNLFLVIRDGSDKFLSGFEDQEIRVGYCKLDLLIGAYLGSPVKNFYS